MKAPKAPKSVGTAAPLFQPKPLRWEDVEWPAIMQRPDFQMLGLCNRHVEIDQTGRDWYGMPLLVDAQAAPVQGVPFVAEFTNRDEQELNDHLWKLEFLGRGQVVRPPKTATAVTSASR